MAEQSLTADQKENLVQQLQLQVALESAQKMLGVSICNIASSSIYLLTIYPFFTIDNDRRMFQEMCSKAWFNFRFIRNGNDFYAHRHELSLTNR